MNRALLVLGLVVLVGCASYAPVRITQRELDYRECESHEPWVSALPFGGWVQAGRVNACMEAKGYTADQLRYRYQ